MFGSRGAVVATLALSLVAGGGDALTGGRPIGVAPPCGNPIPVEPVLVWDTTGATLTGPLHSHMAVYSNGLVALASTGGLSEGGGSASTIFTSPAAVEALRQDLVASGAFGLCDQEFSVSDVPLNTVTVHFGATDSRAHTFSFWVGIDGYAAVTAAVAAFQANL